MTIEQWSVAAVPRHARIAKADYRAVVTRDTIDFDRLDVEVVNLQAT